MKWNKELKKKRWFNTTNSQINTQTWELLKEKRKQKTQPNKQTKSSYVLEDMVGYVP